MTTKISVDAYEAAERHLLLDRAHKVWRRHAITFAVALGLIVLVELGWGGTSWLVYSCLACGQSWSASTTEAGYDTATSGFASNKAGSSGTPADRTSSA